jgi:hypothetical protein
MKRVYFMAALTIFAVFNVYARGRVEKTYQYHYPKQYTINMSKEEMVSKLKNIVNLYEDGNYFCIPVRLYILKTLKGNEAVTLMNDQVGDIQKFGDVTFYFIIQYTGNGILLYGCDAFIAEDLNFVPDEIEVEKTFHHNIVDYLLGEEIPFEYDDKESVALVNTTEFKYIQISRGVPSYGDFRTKKIIMYWLENVGSISKIELINSILKYEWIIKRVQFPGDYIFYRYPNYQIEIYNTYNSYIIITIWKNADQYFVQLSTTKEYYLIDKNKLNEILLLLNIEV